MEQRPAVGRRHAIQEGMADRGENEERADVARRLDRLETGPEVPKGPSSYVIGSEQDPDYVPDPVSGDDAPPHDVLREGRDARRTNNSAGTPEKHED